MKYYLLMACLNLLCIQCLVSCGQAASVDVVKDPSTAPAATSGPSLDSVGTISWAAMPGNTYFFPDASGNTFYVYVQVRGNDVLTGKSRVPLNISVVLDRSGSMAGDKMTYAKKAATFLVEQLGQDDILSLVNYDDKVEVTYPSMRITNKEIVKQKIAELTDRGSTNLTGGMLEGFTQVQSTRKDGYVNRVLLLTDGLANIGITDPQQIKKVVDKKYREQGIALSTFGLGADYNEDLLTMLAETGRANYYFIDNPDKIPGIFAAELKGLLSVVAQNAWVEVSLPAALGCTQVYGYPYEVKDNKVQVRLNDIYARDEKGILFKFKSKVPVKEALTLQCRLQGTDAVSFNAINQVKEIKWLQASNPQMVQQHEDTLVQEMIALYEANKVFDDIMTAVDAGHYEQARALADAAVSTLKEKQKTIRSDKLRKQEESISAYSKDMDSVKTMQEQEKKIYQKSNKSTNYLIRKGKAN